LILDYPDHFAVVTYHASNDPFNTYNPADNWARFYYYPPHPDGNYYIPYAWIGGIIRGGYEDSQWENMMLNRYAVDSPLEIQINGDYDFMSRTGNLEITVTAHEDITHTGLVVMTALTEDSLYYQGSNGTEWHNKTMRHLFPDTLGIPLTIQQGETVSITQAFSCPEPLVVDKCELVVWVQANPEDREVLQAAKSMVLALAPVSVDEEPNMPSGYYLSQNYPNPFNASTMISFNLSEPSDVRVEIFDLLGRGIVTLLNELKQAGEHQVVWNAGDQPSGVYFYKMETGNISETRKMVLMK